MPIEVNTDKAVCSKCGRAFGKYKGNFPVSYSTLYKGVGHLPICKSCVEVIFNDYLNKCNDAKTAVRQVCRKLDLYWDGGAYDSVSKKNSNRTIMIQYMQRINSVNYAGKSYDDTLIEENMLWDFDTVRVGARTEQDNAGSPDVSEEVVAFWGSGYTPGMYAELEQRRAYWMSRFPEGTELDIGTEALIRQICSLELDINRDRAAGRSVEKSVTALNALLGSANLKPVQKRQDDIDSSITSTPLGVWLYRYENKRPLPEIDEDLKDVNGLRRYVFTWMGHLCKMLGLKNAYSKMYEDEIARLRVDKPEYDGEDDETFLTEVMMDEPPGTEYGDDSI